MYLDLQFFIDVGDDDVYWVDLFLFVWCCLIVLVGLVVGGLVSVFIVVVVCVGSVVNIIEFG